MTVAAPSVVGVEVGGNLVELILAAFGEVLEAAIGPLDNFFEHGGDSLASMIVVSRLQESLQLRIAPDAVLANPTADALAGAIARGVVVEPDADDMPTAPAPRHAGGVVPASFAQQSALHIAPTLASRGFLSWVYQLNGALDVGALSTAIDDVVRRYEILRTRFELHVGGLAQVVDAFVPGVLKVVQLDPPSKGDGLKEAVRRIEREFLAMSPTETPTLHAVLYVIGPKTSVLAIFVAEAVVDSDSGTLVAVEISRAYAKEVGAESLDNRTAPVAASYVEHVLANPVHDAAIRAATAHWRHQAETVPLPCVYGSAPTGTRATAAFAIDAPDWAEAVALVQRLQVTPYVLVLACLQVALARVAGLRHFLVDSAVTDRSDPATHNMIGNFQAAVRIECRVQDDDALVDVVTRTAAAIREAVAHCSLPAPLLDDEDGGSPYSWPAPIAFFMFQSHEGPIFPGTRRRRFRLGTPTSRALRLNCSSGPDGRQDFVFESTTAPTAWLDRFVAVFRTALEMIASDPGAGLAPLGWDNRS